MRMPERDAHHGRLGTPSAGLTLSVICLTKKAGISHFLFTAVL
jgi:hypothetical protein